MTLRPKALELAILGRLLQGPGHGYLIRKHLIAVFGAMHTISYGSLYPALQRLTARGLVCDCGAGVARLVGGRSRRVYHITPDGREYLIQDVGDTAAADWEDDDFGARFSLLDQASSQTRVGLMRGRRAYAKSRLARLQANVQPDFDPYTKELVRHAAEMISLEIEWLDQLIAKEEDANSGAQLIKENR